MNKKVLFLCALFLIYSKISSQKIKTQNELVFKNKKEKFFFPAAFDLFQTGDTYSVKASENVAKKEEVFDPLNGKSVAKYVPLEENPDYIFHIITSEPQEAKVEYLQQKEIKGTRASEQQDSYIGVISFPFLFKIAITNSKGDTIKQVVIYDELTPYNGYLINGECSGLTCAEYTENLMGREAGFASTELADHYYKIEKEKILQDSYKKAYEKGKNKTRSVFKNLFINFSPSYNFYIKSLNRKEQKLFPDIYSDIEKFRNSCALWASNQKDEENLIEIKNLADSFSEKAKNKKNKNIKDLLNLNAGIGYLLCRDYEKSLLLCGEALSKESFFSNTRLSTLALYANLREYDELSRDAEVIYGSKKYDLEEDYKELMQNKK